MTPSDYPDESATGPGGAAVAAAGDLPDAPDFARFLPVATIEQAKQQQQADEWGQVQQQKIAAMWGQLAQDRLDQTVQQATQMQWQPAQPTAIDQPQQPAAPPEVNPVTAEPTTNPVIEQFLSGLGGLMDKMKPTPEMAADPTAGMPPLDKVLPSLESVAAPVGESIDKLTGGKFGEATGAIGNLSLNPSGLAQAEGMPLSPEDRAAMEAASSPTVGDVASTAARLIQPSPGKANTIAETAWGSGMARQILESQGVPSMVGAAEDGIVPIAQLTADHPIVQAVAKATSEVAGKEINPEAVAKLIQSPGFNPVNLAKSTGRNGPVQQAALTAYRTANDSEMANAILNAAKEATGKAEPTVDEEWNAIPGLGGRIGESAPAPLEASAPAGKTPEPPAKTTFGDVWRSVNRGIVQAKLMNPLIHTWNLLSETLSQYADPRQLAGIVGDFKAAEAAMRDPELAAKMVEESGGRLNLASMRPYADDIGNAVKGGLSNVPVVGGAKNAYDAVTAFNHRMLFENLGQRLQLASYEGAKRMGMDPEAAAAYANAKFGQISKADQNDLMQWVGQNAAFAGKWVQGTGIQLGSLVGKPGFGGYAAGLSDAQKAQLASGLRGDFLKGVGMLIGSHAIINHQLSGQWPWQNEDGRWLDINTGQQTPDGKTIYVPDPFFRRVQDAAHLLAVPIPGNPLTKGMGTTTTSALVNKAAPLIGTAADIASGSQYLSPSSQPPGITGGPPIIAKGSDVGDAMKQAAAFAWNQVSPVQVKAGAATRSPEGIKLANPEIGLDAGPGGSKAGVAAGIAGAITGANAVTGPKEIGTKEEYFQQQEDQAYGTSAKPFRDAGVPLSTMPNQFSAGSGANKVSVPTTAADRPIFQEAYKKVLDAGLAQAAGKTNKAVLAAIEQKAFTAGKAAVEKTLTKDEVQRRMGVAQGGAESATSFWKSGASAPSSTPAAPARSAPAAAFWKAA